MNDIFYDALLNSETKESLARMVVHLRRELTRRDEASRALRRVMREMTEKFDEFASRSCI